MFTCFGMLGDLDEGGGVGWGGGTCDALTGKQAA